MTRNDRHELPILITGCSSGIGRCVAEGLRNLGYPVYPTARKRQDVEVLRANGFEAMQLDLTNSASIQGAVEAMLKRTGGRIYALFNNGGFGQPGAVEDLTRGALREQFEVNFLGTHELTCQVIPAMRRQGFGRIIQNSSVLGFIALKYRGAYNASKYALEGLTDTLRLELKDTGIHVSLIEPGSIESRFRENAYAAFKRNIDAEKSVHRAIYESLEARLRTSGAVVPFTLPADAVLKKVLHALESPHPRARYYVTFPTYVFALLKRILPSGMLDTVLIRTSSLENR
ncbi:MAG: SDR family oxidoreductase [Gammaproteobacteria bacterium]|nr:SDR family oxidoreductase [Gammaproteobacteria bacterium]